MKSTEVFKEQLATAWGKPLAVAHATLNEMFRHDDEIGGLDHDDQVNYALRIGVLAGELKDSDPGAFIQRFEKEILGEE